MPTNTTSRSPGSTVPSASAASPARRAKEEPSSRGRLGRGQPLAEALQAGARRGGLARREAVDVDAGRPQARPAGQLRVAHRLPQALRRVARADEHPAGAGEALARERHEALRVALDGVLERAAVDLDRVGHAEPLQRAGEDHRAHHQVVGERDVGPHALGHLAHRGHVALQVAVDLGLVEVLERARLDALVAIGDVERQQARDVGPVDRHASGLATGLERPARRRPSRRRRRPSRGRAGRGPG